MRASTRSCTALQFYKALFGWTTNDISTPPHWLVYFAVDDTDAIVRQSESQGGTTIVPPMDVANVGRFAVLRDPQGGYFAVIKLG